MGRAASSSHCWRADTAAMLLAQQTVRVLTPDLYQSWLRSLVFRVGHGRVWAGSSCPDAGPHAE
jgi:hypothetical protein